MRNKVKELVLTDKAVQWLSKYVQPIAALDFVGYMVSLQPTLDVTLAVPIKGQLRLISENPKKPVLSKFKYWKTIRHLMKIKFIKNKQISPFEEFELYNNIPLNKDNLIYLPTTFFEETIDYEKR